jgi:integrase
MGDGRRQLFKLVDIRSAEEAERRLHVLHRIKSSLLRAGKGKLTQLLLKRAAGISGSRADVELAALLEVVQQVCVGKLEQPANPGRIHARMTIRELGEAWTSGKLHELHPDHIRERSDMGKVVSQLRLHILPTVGDVRICDFRIDHADAVMRAIPKPLAVGTRRQIAMTLRRILAMASYPLRLIVANPMPEGYAPRSQDKNAKSILYPDEDAVLCTASKVPLIYRLFYGFLLREGCRSDSEARKLTWRCFDLSRGVMVLDRNKTNSPRAWKLGPGVAEALRAWRIVQGERGVNVGNDCRVFPLVSAANEAELFRKHLKIAGVTRTLLFERTKERLPIRRHDLRGTFITLNLAAGKSEAWIQQRTGHTTSRMINAYNQPARTAEELDLGLPRPLVEVIPELAAVTARSNGSV